MSRKPPSLLIVTLVLILGTAIIARAADPDLMAAFSVTGKVGLKWSKIEGGSEVFSGEKSVTVPGEVVGFKAPTWVGIRMDQDNLFLNWYAVPGAMAYMIWRSDTSGSGYENIGNTQDLRFVDKAGLVKGNTYYYALTAINAEFDETPFSKEKSYKYGRR